MPGLDGRVVGLLGCSLCPAANAAKGHVWTAPAVQGESDYQRSVRVQSCIRPLSAADLTAGPDVIR
jgi:hypothetical protein